MIFEMPNLERSILEAALLGYELRRDNIVGHIAEIQAELRERVRGGRTPHNHDGDGGGVAVVAPKKRTFSQETRAKMSRAQRKRWRQAKRERAAAAG
jgi:hypothetical protein